MMQATEPTGSLTRRVGSFSIATLLSRILGLARDMTIAYLFGAGRETDSFIVAFRIPNLMRDLFAEGGLSAAFVPTFTRYLTKEGRAEAFRLASITINLILVVVGGVVIIGILVAPHLVKVIAYGFVDVPGKMALTLTMTRILFPFLLLVSLAAVVMGILNSLKHFFTPAIAPAGFNLSIILAGVLAAPLMPRIGMEPIVSIAVGAVVGGLLQVGIQIPLLLKEGFKHRPTLNLAHPGLKEIAAIYFPATFGLMASKVNMVVNTFLATLLQESTVSHLTFSYRIMNFPLGLFGVAVATVALPSLSGAAASNDLAELKQTFVRGLRLSLFLMIPSSLFLIFLSQPIIELIYQRGRFLEGDTHPTSQALMLYSVGLFALAAVRLLAYCFYSLREARTPMKISFVAVAVNIGLNLSLMYHIGFKAFPISASTSAVLQMTLLWHSLRRRLGDLPLVQILTFAAKVVLAALAMGVCAKSVYGLFPSSLGFAAAALLGGAVFLLASRLWGLPEGEMIQRLLLKPQGIWNRRG